MHVLKRGSQWYAALEHGLQPALVCGRRGHPTVWPTGRDDPTTCARCGGELELQRRRRQEWVHGRTRREVEAKVIAHRAAKEAGRVVRPSRERLVDEYLPRWHSRRDDDVIEPSSFANEGRHLAVHVYSSRALQGMLVKELTAAHRDALDAELKAKRLAPASRRTILGIVSTALEDAVDEGLLVSNPWRRRPRRGRSRAKGEHPRERDFVTAEQLTAFWPKVRGDRDYAVWWLLAYTGMRRSEALGVYDDDVDLDSERPTVRVKRAYKDVGGKPVIGDCKTPNSIRTIALDEETVRVLRAWRQRKREERLAAGPAWVETPFLFTDDHGQPMDPRAASKRFARRAARHGLGIDGFHGFRHSHCAQLVSAGVPVLVVSRRLGHSKVAFTLDRYGHLLPDDDAAAVEAVSRLQAV
jgi:integrase